MSTRKPIILGIRACTWVWIIMLMLSLLTYLAGQQGLSGLSISLGVLFLALVKGHLLGAYFMGLGRVRGFWHWPVTLWLLLPGSLIGIAFILAS